MIRSPSPPPDPLLLARLWDAHRALEQRLEADLARLGITLGAFRVIGELLDEPAGLSVDQLAERLAIPAMGVRDLVAELDTQGLVQPTGARDLSGQPTLRVSDEAELDEGFDVLDAVEHRAFGALAEDERVTLHGVLAAVTSALRGDAD